MHADQFPKIIFGTSALGNLYRDPGFETKKQVVSEIVKHSPGVPVFDSAGKYGAGLALESLAAALKSLNVAPSEVQISNKLGWLRTELLSDEPTFEPGAWVNLENDAKQDISYSGILRCFEQGNELLGDYPSRIVSIHDPDEYLAAATDAQDKAKRQNDILEAYRALAELKQKGEVDSIGVGAKNTEVINFISAHIQLDWAMFACSVTPYSHKPEVLALLKRLGSSGVKVINSAVFNGGFLMGGDYFDYTKVDRESAPELFHWRDQFFAICQKYDVDPAAACVQFSYLFPEIVSVALSTSSPSRVEGNMALANAAIPGAFWRELQDANLISGDLATV